MGPDKQWLFLFKCFGNSFNQKREKKQNLKVILKNPTNQNLPCFPYSHTPAFRLIEVSLSQVQRKSESISEVAGFSQVTQVKNGISFPAAIITPPPPFPNLSLQPVIKNAVISPLKQLFVDSSVISHVFRRD